MPLSVNILLNVTKLLAFFPDVSITEALLILFKILKSVRFQYCDRLSADISICFGQKMSVSYWAYVLRKSSSLKSITQILLFFLWGNSLLKRFFANMKLPRVRSIRREWFGYNWINIFTFKSFQYRTCIETESPLSLPENVPVFMTFHSWPRAPLTVYFRHPSLRYTKGKK